ADEQAAVAPLGNTALAPDFRLVFSLMPGETQRGHVPAGFVLVSGTHGGGRQLPMRRRSAGFYGQGRAQAQGPEGQVDPVAAQVAHGAAAEVPPAIPLWPGHIDVVKRPVRRRTKP